MARTISFDDSVEYNGNSNSSGDIIFYRGRTGYTDRIALLTDQPYVEYNYYTELNDREGYWKAVGKEVDGRFEVDPLLLEKLGEPDPRFGLPIVQYSTTKDGDLKEPFSWQTAVWIFSLNKFNDLKKLKKQWGSITDRDLSITCVEESRQNLKIAPLPQALWLENETIKQQILASAKEFQETIPKLIGRRTTIDDWKRKFGISSVESSGKVDLNAPVDIDSILGSD